MNRLRFTLSILIVAALFTGCEKTKSSKKIAVFVPGIVDNSPVYEMLVQGVTEAVDSYNMDVSEEQKASLFVLEAGTNQAEWSSKLTSLAASRKYDLIISSNSALPSLVEPLTRQFPAQKFILLDAEFSGNKNIYTCCYNQYEQAFLTGLIAGYMSKTHKLALIAAQEYPVMNDIIYPYFSKGAKAASADSSVVFQVVGNWYDANKAAQLADACAMSGVDVILPICGGAAPGVINSAVNNGIYVTWFDDNGFSKAPGTIISSTTMEQKKMAQIATSDWLNNSTKWGTADMAGLKEGFINFVQDDENYIKTVPQEIREKMAQTVQEMKNGQFEFN